MSIKKIKQSGLILCCMLLCACVVGMISFVPKTYADDDVTAITLSELTTFTTTDGASIRTETPTGIRFATTISQDEYNGLVKQYGSENLEFGMAIARVGSLEELKAADTTKTLKPMSYWMAGAYPGSGAQTYQYSFAIVSLSESNYNRQYTTIGYVKAGDEIAYAKDANGQEFACTRTPLEVATTILATMPDDENGYASQIVDTVMATGVTFEVQDASAPWGQEIELVATVDGKAVTPVYTVSDSTVAKAEGSKIIGLKKGTTEVTATLNGVSQTYTATATVTFTEKEITPALNAEGMLDLLTEGEQTTISVYASTDTEFATPLTTATTDQTTFDIREEIVSYMEEQSATNGDYSYIVVVESDSYVGTYQTETFVPITQASEMIELMPTAANQKATALTLAGEKYYYLANDIDVSQYNFRASAYGRYSMGSHLEFNLDGRGNTITNEYTHTNAGYGYCGFAPYWGMGDTNVRNWWKNVHYKANITINSGAIVRDVIGGDLSFYDFYDCYFDVTVTNNASEDIGMFGVHQASFSNCIFEMTNFSNDTSDLVLLRKNDSYTGANLYNCVVINNDDNTDVITRWTTNTGDVSAYTVYRYNSVADFIVGNNGTLRNDRDTSQNGIVADGTICYNGWSNVWEVTETDIILCGETVRTTLQSEVTPALNTDGMLALGTKGEETSIKVYNSTDTENAILTDITTDTTYDIRENILTWMEENVTTTGSYVYTVQVESRSYVGTYTSETFVPITSVEEFLQLGVSNVDLTASDVKYEYNYLTTDLDISSYAGRNSRHGVSVWAMAEFNLDGRGHTITNNYAHTVTNSSYRGLACYMGHIDSTTRNWWKNLSYVANITSDGYRLHNLISCNVTAFDFYNCYFEATVVNNGTTNCGFFDVVYSTFNNCMFVLNNSTEDKYDLMVFAKAEKNCASSSLNNCAIINNNESETNVVATDCTGLVVHTAYRYNSIADFIAGNSGTLRNDDNTSQNGTVIDGTKCYTSWDSVWSITDSGITLCGQQIK